MKLLPRLLLILCLCGPVFGDEVIERPIGDLGVRAMLGISSFFANTKPPKGTKTFICTFAKFESGEFKGFGGYMDSPLVGSPFYVELLWGPAGDSTGWALATPSSQTAGKRVDPFFKNIKTAGWTSFEVRDSTTNEPVMFRNYRVLGMVSDGQGPAAVGPDVDFFGHLKNFRHSVVLLVRFFDDHESYIKGVNEIRAATKKED
jgi:hypothetical protein